jgi:hypothetical protein
MSPSSVDGNVSYVKDEKYKNTLAKKIMAYVYKNKDHPAILFWNIGNEVVYWTKDEKERIAFCQFLDEIIREVHRIDPHHPIVYTTAFATAIPYIKKYVPHLDILGVNVYGGFDNLHRKVVSQLNIPYIVTEYGPLGSWDRPEDMNRVPLESTDDLKAHYYKKYAHKIQNAYGYCLGGFAFYLGDTTQTSYTWWNLTYGSYLKQAYLTIQEFYTGKKVQQWPPVIKDMKFSKRKKLVPGEWFTVELKIDRQEKVVRYVYFMTTARNILYFDNYPNKKVFVRVEGNGMNVKMRAPSISGNYRIYAMVYDDLGRVSIYNKSISVDLKR